MGLETAQMEFCGLPGAQMRRTRAPQHFWENSLRSPGTRAACRESHLLLERLFDLSDFLLSSAEVAFGFAFGF